MVERKAFLANPKHQCHLSQCEEHDCSATNKNNRDYCKRPSLSHFTDIRKMLEKKHFLAKPKHQYHASKCGEHDCSATNKKNAEYYNCPKLYHFMDEL